VPSVRILVRISEALGISMDYLAGRTDVTVAAGRDAEAVFQALGRLRSADVALVGEIITILQRRSPAP
jgi:hypothetical protein